MSCCGGMRSSARSAPTPKVPAAAVAVAGERLAPPAGAAQRGSEFQYLGGGVLTVVGQGTGLRYRFVGHGARVSVYPSDRATMARVPQLRELPKRD